MAFPIPIAEDEGSVTFQAPNGQPLRLPKDLAQNVGWQPHLTSTQPPAIVQEPPRPLSLGIEQGNVGFENETAGFTQNPNLNEEIFQQPPAQPLPDIVQPDPADVNRLPKAQQGLAAQEQGFDLQQQAIQRQTMVQEQSDKEAAGILAAKNRALARRDVLEGQKQAEEDRIRDAEQASIAKDMEETSKLTVDRGAYLRNMSGGRKIGLGLSVLMAGIGSAIKGQGDKNPALDLVMSQMDKSVADQMAMIDKKRGDIAMKRQILGDKVANWKDRRAQAEVLRARIIEASAGHLEELMSKTKSELAKANGAQALGALSQARGQAIQQAFQYEQESRRADRQVAIAGGHLKLARDQFNAQNAERLALLPYTIMGEQAKVDSVYAQKAKNEADAKAAAGKGVIFNPETAEPIGQAGHLTAEQQGNLQKEVTAAIKSRAGLTELANGVEKYGRKLPGGGLAPFSSTDRRKLENTRQEIIGRLTKDIYGSTANEAERATIEAQIPGIQGLLEQADPAAVLRDRIRKSDEDFGRTLRGNGFQEDQIQAALRNIESRQNPKGNDPGQNPGAIALDSLGKAVGLTDTVKALKAVGTYAAGRDFGAFLGEDVKARVGSYAETVINDPKASQEQKRVARAAITAVGQANQRELAADGNWLVKTVAKGRGETR